MGTKERTPHIRGRGEPSLGDTSWSGRGAVAPSGLQLSGNEQTLQREPQAPEAGDGDAGLSGRVLKSGGRSRATAVASGLPAVAQGRREPPPRERGGGGGEGSCVREAEPLVSILMPKTQKIVTSVEGPQETGTHGPCGGQRASSLSLHAGQELPARPGPSRGNSPVALPPPPPRDVHETRTTEEVWSQQRVPSVVSRSALHLPRRSCPVGGRRSLGSHLLSAAF